MANTLSQRNIVPHIVLSLGAIIMVGPFVWEILTSFKTRADIFSGDLFAAFAPTIDNYVTAFGQKGFTRNLVNSAIIIVIMLIGMYLFGKPLKSNERITG